MIFDRRRKSAESGAGVPGWIVSFTDMVTLLLSFFIMLQSLAIKQDAEIFYQGQGGFRRAIAGFGVPDWLFGQREQTDLGNVRVEHPTEEDPDAVTRHRPIDPEDDKIRQVFDDLRRMAETHVTDYSGQPLRLVVTPIRFGPSDATVDESAREFLTALVAGLRPKAGGRAPSLQVIALAPDVTDPDTQWMLSAARAKAVETVLVDALDAEMPGSGAQVESWGAGGSGRWGVAAGKVPHPTYVVIGLLEAPPRKEANHG